MEIADKVLRDKAFKIASDQKYGYQKGLASMVYKFFDKKYEEAVLLIIKKIYN